MNTKREREWRQNTAVKNWWAVGTHAMEREFHNGLEPAPPKSLPTITKENETLNKPEEWGVVGVEVGGGSPPSAGTALRTRETEVEAVPGNCTTHRAATLFRNV